MYSFSDGFPSDNVITGQIDLNVGPGAEYENLDAVKAFLNGKVFAEGAGARLIFTPGTHNYPDGFSINSADNIYWERVSLVFPPVAYSSSSGSISSVVLSADEQNYLMKIDLGDTSEAEVGMFVAANSFEGIGTGAWEIAEVVDNEYIVVLIKNTGVNSQAYLSASGSISAMFLKAHFIGFMRFINVNMSYSGAFSINGNGAVSSLKVTSSRIITDDMNPIVAASGGFFGVIYQDGILQGSIYASSATFSGINASGDIGFYGAIVNCGVFGIAAISCYGVFDCIAMDANGTLISASRMSKFRIQASRIKGNSSGGVSEGNSNVSISELEISFDGYNTLDFTPALNVIAADGSVIYG